MRSNSVCGRGRGIGHCTQLDGIGHAVVDIENVLSNVIHTMIFGAALFQFFVMSMVDANIVFVS